MSQVWLIRHAEPSDEEPWDPPLSPTGVSQARALADALAGELVERVIACWGGGAWEQVDAQAAAMPESKRLTLDASRARAELGWRPVWSLADSVAQTVEVYRRASVEPLDRLCAEELARYERARGRA